MPDCSIFKSSAKRAISDAQLAVSSYHGDFIDIICIHKKASVCAHDTGIYQPKEEGQVLGAGCGKYAREKAVFEAIERDCLRYGYKTDVHDIAESLPNLIGADILAPLSTEQIGNIQKHNQNFQGYRKNLKIDWVLGQDFAGTNVYVPSELVYYGNYINNKIYYANSSGTAAHTSFEEAKLSALEELIERDALMRLWLSQKSPSIIPDELLPERIKYQKSLVKQHGLTITLLDLTAFSYQSSPTFMATIHSKVKPYFTYGSATRLNNPEAALVKAIEEALHSYTYYTSQRHFLDHKINKWQIMNPWGHGLWYAGSLKHTRELSWLYNKAQSKGGWKDNKQDLKTLFKDLGVISIDLTPLDLNYIKVARVFSPYLIPISFGMNQLHYLKFDGDIVSKALKNPHFFI